HLAGENKALAQGRFDRNHGSAIDPEGFAATRDQEQQRNPWIGDEIAQAIDAVVAAAIGNEQGLLVNDAHKARWVAARRAVESASAASRHCAERRRFDEGAIVRVDVVNLLHHRSPGRRSVNCLERLERSDQMMTRSIGCHAALLLRPVPVIAHHFCGVMAGLVAGIHVFSLSKSARKAGMLATSAAMTA